MNMIKPIRRNEEETAMIAEDSNGFLQKQREEWGKKEANTQEHGVTSKLKPDASSL
jgi:hypothetical protein